MATDSPFLNFKIECPVCKTVNEFESVRVGAYTEDGRDTDFCPMNIKWRFPRYQGSNPLLYFTATCAHCSYTREMNNQYKDWKSDNHYRTYRLKTIKPKHLEQLAEDGSIIHRISDPIDSASNPNESAILKLTMAIYDELLGDRPNALDLGRFYLRIGWVFRDMAKGEDPARLTLQGMMHELEGKHSVLKTSMESLGRDIAAFDTLAMAQYDSDQLPTAIKSQMLPFKERFEAEIAGLSSSLQNSQQQLSSTDSLLDEYRLGLLGDGAGAGLAFGGAPSFEAYLADLKKLWDGAVTCEKDALTKSAHYYSEAFASGRDIAAGNQQIQASYLIAELSRRVGNHDTAKQFFNSTIKSGQAFIYQNRTDQSRTVLARKIMELAIEQGRSNLAALKPA
ncbi:MAG: DUF2225 domain-containing protein [candidate division Zixibacteria bacterium]